jgi:hypothetical protein
VYTGGLSSIVESPHEFLPSDFSLDTKPTVTREEYIKRPTRFVDFKVSTVRILQNPNNVRWPWC